MPYTPTDPEHHGWLAGEPFDDIVAIFSFLGCQDAKVPAPGVTGAAEVDLE